MSEDKDIIAKLKKDKENLYKRIEELESEVTVSNLAFLNIVGKSLDAIIIMSLNGTVLYTNPNAISLFQKNITEIMGGELQIDIDLKAASLKPDIEYEFRRDDGSIVITQASVIKTHWNSEACFVVRFRDITEHKKSQKILEHLSEHDYLTGLPNRSLFDKKLKEFIAKAESNVALFYLDLDNFKIINDTLGHDKGDELLKNVASTLQSSTRKDDVVARLGGDEFGIIIKNIKSPSNAETIAGNILDKLSKPFHIANQDIFANLSIGIAIYPYCGQTARDLVKNADTAMYYAKQQGKNQYKFYSKNSEADNDKIIAIINGLPKATQNNELFLEYQPITDLKSGKCNGFESLVRWQHPLYGVITPSEFIPMAEENRRMLEIGLWVLNQAIKDYKALSSLKPIFFSINISSEELDSSNYFNHMNKMVQKSMLEIGQLVLELTESSLSTCHFGCKKTFEELNKLGINVAVDNYGTTSSKIKDLKHLPVSILKIDKSCIASLNSKSSSHKKIKSTIETAHSLGMKTVAEGVETAEQDSILKKLNCDFAQGFYYSKSLKLADLKKYLQKNS